MPRRSLAAQRLHLLLRRRAWRLRWYAGHVPTRPRSLPVWLWSLALGSTLLGCVWVVPCHSQTATRPKRRPVPQTTPTPSQTIPTPPQPTPPPVAVQASTTERTLALSLAQAIQLTLQNNIDLERERFGPRIARTQTEQARAVFDPRIGALLSHGQTRTLPQNQTLQFTETGEVRGRSIIRPFTEQTELTPNLSQKIILGGTYEISFVNTRERVAPANFGTTSRLANPRYESGLALSFTQPLLRDFGIAVNTAPIRQAQQLEDAAQQRVLQMILDAVFLVQQGYWELVFRLQDLGAKRESQKLAEDFLAENKIRVELGSLAPIELVQAETQVKTRQGDVISAESAIKEAEDQLKEILNIPESEGTWALTIQPTDAPVFLPISEIPLEEKMAYALRHRPDVRQADLSVASQEIARDTARNQRLPRLDVEAKVGISGFGKDVGEAIGDLSEADGYQWSLGLRLTYPLGNRAAEQEWQKQRLLLQQALVDQRKTQRTAVRQIRQAVRDIETVSKRVEVTRAATVLARTQLEAEQEKFRLGLSTSFNVLQFQSQLSTARTNETRALSDYNVALARLDQVTGTQQHGVTQGP